MQAEEDGLGLISAPLEMEMRCQELIIHIHVRHKLPELRKDDPQQNIYERGQHLRNLELIHRF